MNDRDKHSHQKHTGLKHFSGTGPQFGLSRRQLIQGVGGMTLLLTAPQKQAGSQAAPPCDTSGNGRLGSAQATTDPGLQQFPYFTDGPWDKPQYYDTIQAGRRFLPHTLQSADIDGDGRDELIARGPGGIHVNSYDPDTGQWIPLADGPAWDDAHFFDFPQYYETLQTADIDGDKQAELLIRDHEGIKPWKYNPATQIWSEMPSLPNLSDANGWNKPQYYQTIQCADIDGDGQEELLARGAGGVLAWKYDKGTPGWHLLATNTDLSDTKGWNKPQYYQTIQCADIDGNKQAELLARSVSGIYVWTYQPNTPTSGEWVRHSLGPAWADARGWDKPQYYQTIQCADIDGDGQEELLAHAPDTLEVWKYIQDINGPGGKWDFQSNSLPLDDSDGWYQPQYYRTIQCADIDGDGKAELIARLPDNEAPDNNGVGIVTWSYLARPDDSGTWSVKGYGIPWTDKNGWNRVQHYATIQSARVLKPGEAGYVGDGTHTQACLLGRGSLGMQTWRLTQPGFVQTSARFPAFTEGQQKAYNLIGARIGDPLANDIRAQYNNQDFSKFSRWQYDFYNTTNNYPLPGSYDQSPRPPSALSPPAGVSQTDWEAVTWQIYWELQWVQDIYDWYGPDKAGGLIDKNTIAQITLLQRVGNELSLPNDSTLQILFTILALIASAAAAILTGGASLVAEGTAATLGFLSAIAGGMAGAFSAVPGLLPAGGGAFETTYNLLQSHIECAFDGAVRGNDKNLFALTGGTDTDKRYVPADYGRLKLIGQWIETGVWSWETDSNGGTTSDLLLRMERGYALYIWQQLLAAQPWYVCQGGVPYTDFPTPEDFPSKYIYSVGDEDFQKWYISTSYTIYSDVLPSNVLSDLFDPPKEGQVFPLSVPIGDYYLGLHGFAWSPYGLGSKTISEVASSSVGIGSPPGFRPTLGVDIRLSEELTRDPVTGEVVVLVTGRNLGTTPATNVEITAARLNLRSLLANHTPRQTRIPSNNDTYFQLRFPGLVGQMAVLQISGSYLGGTFGGSFRVILP